MGDTRPPDAVDRYGRFDPRYDDAVGADIEHPFDLSKVQIGDADERRRVAADRGPHVFENIVPVEVKPCSPASMTTQSSPRATAISVMLAD